VTIPGKIASPFAAVSESNPGRRRFFTDDSEHLPAGFPDMAHRSIVQSITAVLAAADNFRPLVRRLMLF
jgi:hypothetical protein